MGLRTFIFIGLLILLQNKNFSQDYFSSAPGNFAGISGIINNPASAADNRLKLDILPGGTTFQFNNSWFAIKREALKYTNGAFPASWQNQTPNVPGNAYKNFKPFPSAENKSLLFENRIFLPSAMWQINSKNTVAFIWQLRQITNIDGISPQVAYLFEKELDLGVTQNNRVMNKRMSAVQMSWAEYGLTYARVLIDREQHFVKAGISPKLLQGFEAGYVIISDLDFILSTKDTLSYFNSKFSSARSGNFNSPMQNGQRAADFYKFVSKPGVGLDLGFVYEWRPASLQSKTGTDKGNAGCPKNENSYRLKFSAALVDLGRIKFTKEGKYYDLDISVRKDNVSKFFSLNNTAELDSLLRSDFAGTNSGNSFSILLPTAFNTQIDLRIARGFYVNLSSHLGNLMKNNLYRVHNYSCLSFAPRYEHYWFELALPLTYNSLSANRKQYLSTGLNLRLGPLTLGTSDFLPLFKGDVAALNFVALLKISIPHKKCRDRDGDGITDKKDECPDERGPMALSGCPDADGDQIPDKNDGCPHQAGVALFRGCPDTDGDGITDAEDQCPLEKGGALTKGCPDKDGDGIVDKADACPLEFGPPEYKGCPDPDRDQLPNGTDKCPDEAGPLENFGCPWPDSDKDGVIDPLDSCRFVPGPVAGHGCPEPAKLAPIEKIILQKAFSNLEFESGRDIIKKNSFVSLNALAKLLVLHRANWKIKLSGHTDNEGSETGNLLLSQLRAKAVEQYLVKKGVPFENIITEWFGQSKPIANNLTSLGKRKNRRVEMLVLLNAE